jgi:hypothetical protein
MISASYTVVLVSTEKQRRAAVGTAMIHYSDATARVAERYELLAEKHQPKRISVRRDLG